MDTMSLDLIALEVCVNTWGKFRRLYPALNTPCPKIELNNRLRTTAGRCDYETRTIDLSTLLFLENVAEFENVIIPHEVAHQVAYDLFGDTGHGPAWKSVMLAYGLPAVRCHSLVSKVVESAKAKTEQKKIWRIATGFAVGDVCSWNKRDRAGNETIITGPVIRVNLKTITMKDRTTLKEWRVPFENTCNLRHS